MNAAGADGRQIVNSQVSTCPAVAPTVSTLAGSGSGGGVLGGAGVAAPERQHKGVAGYQIADGQA